MAHILRLPRSDEAESFILVHVSSSGRQQLDLKLVGTEGSAPYVSTGKLGSVEARACGKVTSIDPLVSQARPSERITFKN